MAKEKSITSDQMYKIEENGHNLLGMHRAYMMENAGHGLADFIVTKFNTNLKGKAIVSICGSGNNGGDAFVASRHLSGYHDAKVTVILLGFPADLRTEESKINWGIIENMDSIETIFGNEINDKIKRKISKANIIIDGIFGTGVKGEIRDPHASVIELVNKSRAYVVSVDIPSGMDPNTGEVRDSCVKANATVTFHRMKIGLVNNRKYTGLIHLERIGIPQEAERGVV
jgi:NAD(P)H-hydrate epimerase